MFEMIYIGMQSLATILVVFVAFICFVAVPIIYYKLETIKEKLFSAVLWITSTCIVAFILGYMQVKIRSL